MRSLQQVDLSLFTSTPLDSVIVFLAFLGLAPGVRKQLRLSQVTVRKRRVKPVLLCARFDSRLILLIVSSIYQDSLIYGGIGLFV